MATVNIGGSSYEASSDGVITTSTDFQISTHFRASEFNTSNNSSWKVSYVLVQKLESLYKVLGATSHDISSGYRGGDSGSQHQLGKAADIKFMVDGKVIHTKIVVLAAAYAVGFTGVANISKNYAYTHLDVRTGNTYYGDEIYGYRSISKQAGPGGRTYSNFREYYNVSDAEMSILMSMSVSGNKKANYELLSTDDRFIVEEGVGGEGATQEREKQEVQISQEVVDAINASISNMLDASVNNIKSAGYAYRYIGSPFRFLDETDPIQNYSGDSAQESFSEGRGYMYHIASEAPLVHFIPGLPTYLKDFDANNKEALSQYINNKSLGNEMSSSIINRINGIEGRYFDFVPAYAAYMKYVNMLCRASAIYMGIGDKFVPGTTIKYKKFNWANWQNGGAHISDGTSEVFDKESEWTETAGEVGEAVTVLVDNIISKLSTDIFGGYNSVKCYVDTSSSFSEDFSNNTKESAVASLFDTAEGAVKELNFWVGGTEASNTISGIGSTLVSAADKIGEGLLGLLGLGGGNLDNIGNYAGHIITGSNIVFPEMWGDSTYTKSYNFSVTLQSPYGDAESRFLYCIQPMMMLLPLVMPRQTSGNSYTSPFLVRVMAKGWFSCDMGIVEGISVEKGGSDSWSSDGYPLEIKLGIRVKDLYSSMSMASTSEPGLFFNNPTLIEFLSTTCGVDTIQPNISLKVMTMLNLFSNAVTDIPQNTYNKTVQWLNNKAMSWFKLY